MIDVVDERPSMTRSVAWALPAPCVGRLVGRDEAGRPLVLLPGQGEAAVTARSLLAEWPVTAVEGRPIEVLLVFDGGDPARPIIVGLLHATMAPPAPAPARLSLEAAEELSLKCGQSVLILRADGRITSRGREISSRATGANKIRGSSVFIN